MGLFRKCQTPDFPMAILYQLFYCGPLVRLIFRLIFRESKANAKETTISGAVGVEE